jgi:hypothetical protein
MVENHAVDAGMGISTVILLSRWGIRLQSTFLVVIFSLLFLREGRFMRMRVGW